MARQDEHEAESRLTDEERERIRAEERERARTEERERLRSEERAAREEREERADHDHPHDDHDDHDDHDHPHDDRNDRDPRHTHGVEATHVRGGLSLGAILTGMAVALGAMFLLTALVGGIAVAVGLADEIQPTPMQLGWGLGIALVISQLLAYLWGGYTAGRMARGAGILNGLLVPVVALLLMGLVAAIVAAFGAEVRFVAPFTDLQIPVEQDFVVQFGIGLGIASLVAMLVGAILGGAMGSRWHDKLEATVAEERGYARAA